MNCKECKWMKINSYKFEDGTQTIECEKHNKFLAFTNKNGTLPGSNKFKELIECKGLEAFKGTKLRNETKQSGYVGINWDKSQNKWLVRIWQSDIKKFKTIGQTADLEIAKEMLLKEQCFLSKVEDKKSGITGITWDKKAKAWKVQVWNKATKRHKHIGQTKDLEEAKKLLDEYTKMKEYESREDGRKKVSGIKYIYWNRRNKDWQVSLPCKNKQGKKSTKTLGLYKTIEEAKSVLKEYLSKVGRHEEVEEIIKGA